VDEILGAQFVLNGSRIVNRQALGKNSLCLGEACGHSGISLSSVRASAQTTLNTVSVSEKQGHCIRELKLMQFQSDEPSFGNSYSCRDIFEFFFFLNIDEFN
jgi:hypothetical protein